MQYAVALLAFVATVSAQTATGTPPSCSTDFPQVFEIAAVNVSSTPKRDLVAERGVYCNTIPYITLKGSVMTDQIQRTAEIVANHQFQFDSPLQDPRFYTAGFSVCANNSLALGGSAIFYACLSGNFSNFYDQSQGNQCHQIYLEVLPCDAVDTSQISGTMASPMPSATAPATSATTSATTSASPTPSTPATTSASSAAPTTAATTSSLPGPAIPSPAPFPKGNSTTAAGAPSASAPAPAPATSSVLTAPASGASVVTIGSTFGLLAAALIAFVML